MEWIVILGAIILSIAIFVISQVIGIVILLNENERLRAELEDSQPPF
jgi:hypothetical protein